MINANTPTIEILRRYHYDAAIGADARGDRVAFEQHAWLWVLTLDGIATVRDAEEMIAAEMAALQGTRRRALETMIYG